MALARYAVAKVEIYTTTYCPFCTRAKSLLKNKNIAFVEIDVTEDDALRAKMIELSGGRRSVPEIFINGKIVGGFDELKALNDAGKLDGLLAESAPPA
jgi:glutaredoxin 3